MQLLRFSIQVDESSLTNNEELLFSYVGFIKKEKIIKSYYLLKMWKLLFNTMNKFLQEKDFPIHIILSAATDGIVEGYDSVEFLEWKGKRLLSFFGMEREKTLRSNGYEQRIVVKYKGVF